MTNRSFQLENCKTIIPLTAHTKVLVEEGETVLAGETLAEGKEVVQEFNLSKELKVSPAKVSGCLQVVLGSKVKAGEVLAERKSLLEKHIFKCPVDGVVTELLPEGFLRLVVSENQEIKSPVKGRVVRIQEGESIELEFEACILTGEQGVGSKKWGEVEVLEKQEEISFLDLPSLARARDKILIVRGPISPGFIHKAEALDVAGLVGSGFDTKTKTNEIVLLSLGSENHVEELCHELKKHEGKPALISGEEKSLTIPLA